MATYPSSTTDAPDRRARRREATIEEALDHAERIIGEQGVGGLTVTEVARRLGVRSPSLYKYFPSLHAIYDALFSRGLARLEVALQAAIADTPPSPERLRLGVRAVVAWCVGHPALAQLLFWRPLPGFEPAADTFEVSRGQQHHLRRQLAETVANESLHPDADSDEAARLLTVLMSGLMTQQMANQPDATFEDGVFTRLTDQAVDMFLAYYDPEQGR